MAAKVTKVKVQVQGFTLDLPRLARVLKTSVRICPPYNPTEGDEHPETKEFIAIWDTGATNSAISPNVIKSLGLKPSGMTIVQTASDEEHKTETYLVNIILPNKVGISQIRVTAATLKDCDVLIGMDVISQGDFAISNLLGKTTFSFRIPSIERIDFKDRRTQTESTKVSRNSPCPCGSGKKYKKCCGKTVT